MNTEFIDGFETWTFCRRLGQKEWANPVISFTSSDPHLGIRAEFENGTARAKEGFELVTVTSPARFRKELLEETEL